MKQLENTVTIEGGHTATLVKRNDKAAIYRRETAEGQFVSFEVFALRSKDGMEIYPNQKAVQNRWCMCPTSEAKANTWFDRFTNGEIVIPNVDPVTGDPIEAADNRSLDELPDVNVSVDVPSIPAPVVVVNDISPEDALDIPADSAPADVVPTVEVPTAEEDPSAPTVEVPEVTPTANGGVAVTVAKVKKNVVTFNIPTGEFTQADFANANGLPERGVVWSKLDGLVKEGKLTKRFGTTGTGRPKAFFTATATV